MKHSLFLILLAGISFLSAAQTVLNINGQTFTSTTTGYYGGYSVPRSSETTLTFTNNTFNTVNSSGYQLLAGDEIPGSTNNNLDGAVITGNRFYWYGTDPASETHALFTGYNADVVIRYNYMYRSPNAMPRKANGMNNSSGGIAYNIFYDPTVGVAVKGMNDVKIFNNTFYSTKSQAETWRGIIDIHTNTDNGLNAPSTRTKVFNNIFYTTKERININIYESECLVGFESDYNVYYCETGGPHFQIGSNIYTFAEWQGMGYDVHSVILDPDFIDFVNFVPSARVDHGTDLGSEFVSGLAADAVWGTTSPSTVVQNGTWQAGARIFAASSVHATGITVTGAGGSSAISTDNGTLQLTAAVLPETASNKNVIWSVINGTGEATISSSGLVTAIGNGTVTARATALDGSGTYGTLVITISNQVVQVTSINVTGAGGASTITSPGGTLQLYASVLPADATNKTVSWSVINGTGQASINSSGLVTAVSNGTVTARATATDGSGIYGSMVITISSQSVLVTGITVTGAGGANTITIDNGTLQMTATVTPANASNKTVTWSVINGTGSATVSTAGLVTAVTNGTVTVRATANDGSGIYGSLVLTISNQTIPVSSITVTGAGGSSTITTDNGTLQLSASVLPSNATNKTVTWSVTNGTGQATIGSSGLVSAVSDGTVTARATATDGSGIYGTLLISISNQVVPVSGITVTGEGGATIITTANGTLQLTANVSPANATNKSVTWSIVNGTGQATISTSGLVTAASNGTVTAIATANDGSGVSGSLVITISSQLTPVTSITVTGAGGSTNISADNGTLQMSASVLPANATNKNVTWSVINGTGEATISTSGLLTAVSNGTVTARATAADGSGVSGTLVITISNQIVPVSGITVRGEGGATAIFEDGGALQLYADILPDNATDKNVTWTVDYGTGEASISTSGLLTAIYNGTVTARATATDGSDISGTLTINISGQIIKVTDIYVAGENGNSSISSPGESLQLEAEVLPANATNKSVSWSVASVTGAASISANGLVTALENGVVTAQATANDGSGVYGTIDISINANDQKLYSVVSNQYEIRITFYEDFVTWIADLYSLQGYQVMRKIIDSNVVVFDTQHLSPGIYLIVLSKNGQLAVEKVMVPG